MPFRTRYVGAQVAPFCSLQNLKDLVSNKGVNLVRYQVTDNAAGEYDSMQWKSWVRQHLEHIETFGAVLVSSATRLILDIHTPPGGFENGHARLFDPGHWGRITLENMWHEIAARYKNNSLVYAYDLLNEPAGPKKDVKRLMTDLHTTVRAVDRGKRVIISPAFGDIHSLPYTPNINDEKLWYTFHNYFPTSITHQGIAGNPAPRKYPTTQYNYERLKRHLQAAADFQAARRTEVYVGEFSISSFSPSESSVQWLADVTKLYSYFGFQWTYHAWRESPVWDMERDAVVYNVMKKAWRNK